MTKHQLTITGMACEGCAAAVAGALRSVPGAQNVRVTHTDNIAVVEGDVALEALVKAVESAGYGASPQVRSSE